MKKLLLTLLAFFIMAASQPPAGLAANLTIVAKDATSVTLHAEQTGGTQAQLTLEHYCYQGNVYAGFERVRFTGSADATFDIGPRTYHGQNLTPDNCWAQVWYYYPSSQGMYLAGVTTLP